MYICKEFYVVHCVEGLGEIHSHRHSAVYRVVLVVGSFQNISLPLTKDSLELVLSFVQIGSVSDGTD